MNPPTNAATGYGDGMTLSRVPASPTYSALVNAASSSCLEIYGGGTAAGSASEVRTCNGANNQQFARASNRELQVYTGLLTMCLDSNGVTSPGSAVVIENCTVASVSLSKPVVPK
ncbi:ricin-type beta-trefoil lectin domain protein [Streptomyces sp. NPDC093984]|uniref:ricin-type beta-trefoil lectin domain protein n=1 Tax=Streptomyces sp. NPDC093984 TaxID=3366052 RepID=UPI00381C6F31